MTDKFRKYIKIFDIFFIAEFSFFILNLDIITAFLTSVIIFLGIYSFRTYDFEKMGNINESLVRIILGNIFGFFIIIFFDFIIKLDLSRTYFLYGFIFNILFLTIVHKLEYKLFINKMPQKRYLVIGRENEIGNVLNEINKKTLNKIKFVEYINPSPERLDKLVKEGFENQKLKKVKSMASFFLKENTSKFNAILVTDPKLENFVKEQVESYKKDGIEVEYFPDFAEKYLKRIPMEVLERFNEYYEVSFNSKINSSILKRLADIVVSSFLFFLFSPFMLLISIITFIEDGFPIVFSQIRIGKNSEKFIMYKFRSLKNNCKESGKMENPNDEIEKRVLKIGKVIRKIRLDESLQFVNAIKGNMSVVGSRPEMEEFHNEMKDKIPFYTYRLKLNPGITGWAQINYKHTTTIEDYIKKTEYDLYYIKNQNIVLDLQIMLKTIETMLGMKGAR